MKDLSGERGWEYVYKKGLEDQIEMLRDSLELPEGRDLAQYHFLCGQIRGIRLSIDELAETRKRFRIDDDTDFDD